MFPENKGLAITINTNLLAHENEIRIAYAMRDAGVKDYTYILATTPFLERGKLEDLYIKNKTVDASKSYINSEAIKANEGEKISATEAQAEIKEMNNLITDKEITTLMNEDRVTLENEIKANPSKLDVIIQKFSSMLKTIEKIKELPRHLLEEIKEIKNINIFMHKAKEFFEFLHKLEHLTHPE
ncbi:MAG: hypothetical protein WCJ39_07475 [bacterium]